MCSCGKERAEFALYIGEREMYKDGRDVLDGEMRKIDYCAMDNLVHYILTRKRSPC